MLTPTTMTMLFGLHYYQTFFFVFQLPSIPSSKSQYRKASLCEKQISSDDNNDAPAGICVVAVYRSFNNLQALELTQ